MTTHTTTKPRIVVLDGFTLNPGDLSWSGLAALGELTVHDRTPPQEIVARAIGASIGLTNKTVLDASVIGALPELRYIGVLATGHNVVDIAAATTRGIAVTNVPGYGTPSVAQHTFALLLELCQHVGHHASTTRQGRWSGSEDFCYWDFPLVELAGLTLGVVGYGAIGRAVARIGRAFGMDIIAHTEPPCAPEQGVEFVAMDDLFRRADVVTLHCPLTEATRGLVNTRRLALMKPTAFLINTSRGPLVAEQDLAEALNAGRITGAGLDVLVVEPPPPDNPLLAAKNCLVTPHIAWASRAARQRLMDIAVANVRAFLAGQPQNVVNRV
jgi:glycerate dehydrogenase